MPARIVDFTIVQTIAALRNYAVASKLLGSVTAINPDGVN